MTSRERSAPTPELTAKSEALLNDLPLQEDVLLTAMIAYLDPQASIEEAAAGPINYHLNEHGQRVLKNTTSALDTAVKSVVKLLATYQQNPKKILAVGRWCLQAVGRDEQITDSTTLQERQHRYMQALISLHIKLDRLAFPPDDALHSGVPSYVPDGLSDMGSDQRIDQTNRGREKIRVHKAKSLKTNETTFAKIFWGISHSGLPANHERVKQFIVRYLAAAIRNSRPYDSDLRAETRAAFLGRSINLDEITADKMTVCRHHALETQICLQLCGIESSLFKCNASFENSPDILQVSPHAANLVRINGTWYILDTTNPFTNKSGKLEVFMKEIPGVVSPYDPRYEHGRRWEFDNPRRLYLLRNNMFYRIRDNEMNPAN